MNRIFVYGTLMRGYGNNRLIQNGTFVKEGRTLPNFTMVSLGGFPGLLEQGQDAVVGEVWDVDDSTLKMCDRLEGHPTWYRRTPIELEDGEKVEVYIYLKASAKEAGGRVSSGDWREHTNRRSQR